MGVSTNHIHISKNISVRHKDHSPSIHKTDDDEDDDDDDDDNNNNNNNNNKLL